MPDTTPPSNAKIYPRPERQAPSPVLIAISLLVLVLISFFAYRAFTNRASTPSAPTASTEQGGAQQRQMPLVDKRP